MNEPNVAILGLGYVGLPLALEFGKKFETVGFDLYCDRIEQLRCGIDKTNECSFEEIAASERLSLQTRRTR
jgi:UDP-N-acetyl-D-glucosamine/UDP-N-acetyl-D-galactosamine dehydrogenase